MRIILVTFVLVGSVAFFGYWSIGQFNQVFDDLSISNLANNHLVYQSLSRPVTKRASTTPHISLDIADIPDTEDIATSTDLEAVSTSTVHELSFTFPQGDTEVYIGCTYPMSWDLSMTVDSMSVMLVDAGTRIAVEPGASGLERENTVEEDSKNIDWEVGPVWAGEYYIKIFKVNDTDTEIRSKVFVINNMPENTSTSEKEGICEESAALL
ncbi:hypothetical protein COB55_01380 [Candidatus Wolfebacteria bacterium]|nr:MAG: hypothetical protein COB55_01380 [Candidatus Wolfebacteria bacterium]